MFTLYYFPGACSLASHIVLEELGEPFEARRVDFRKDEQKSAAYLAVNPRGRVPALVTPDGVLSESPAILRYLADLRPDLGLLPSDPFERAQAQSMMTWFGSHLHPAIAHVSRWERYTDQEEARAGLGRRARETIEAGFAELDARLAGQAWLLGSYSVADPYLLFLRRVGALLSDMARWPNIVAHAARVAERPAAARALGREGVGPADLDG